MSTGTLYLVSTPIGNLGDATPRSRDLLGGVSVVYAEDTRRTRKLMAHFDLSTPLVSLHAHNERSRAPEVLAALAAGEDVALVTDAGTPAVSDPGAAVVRAAAEAGYRVVAIPGPSAVLAALAVSGFGADRFAFAGFPPRKGPDRVAWIRQLADFGMTTVFFESPRRLPALLADLAEAGLGGTPACVCRELTKVHEEVRRGTVDALADYYSGESVRGEVTVVLSAVETGASEAEAEAERARTAGARMAADLVASGASTRDVVERLKQVFGLTRNEAYELAIGVERAGDEEDGEAT